ncbi:MAG: hypothetical protein ABI255_10345 [Microbacteriaceae bacterium]
MTPPVPPAPQPHLTQAQLYEIVHASLADLIGTSGQWSVVRRTDGDTDTIFHGILTDSVSQQIAGAISAAQAAQEPLPAEPAALAWQPAPITVWADLRKPVTGEIPRIGVEHALVA